MQDQQQKVNEYGHLPKNLTNLIDEMEIFEKYFGDCHQEFAETLYKNNLQSEFETGQALCYIEDDIRSIKAQLNEHIKTLKSSRSHYNSDRSFH